jgi:fructosamine-3-kinase
MDFSSVIDEKIISSVSVSGGGIGSSFRVKTERHEYFVKHYSRTGLSGREAHGLREMAASKTVKVPEVVNFDEHFLVLKFLGQASRCGDFQGRLGRELARMHRITSGQFGFYEDNFIGSNPQINNYKDSWLEFYLENRLDFQVELTGDREVADAYIKLCAKVPELLASSSEEPSLIHGDLWGGNVISGPGGEPVLIDPAVYYGHREAELGMTQLFGGFTNEFYSAYDDEYPLKKGWRSRLDLYKLYHVLNHMNMFGSGYKLQALRLMNGYLNT